MYVCMYVLACSRRYPSTNRLVAPPFYYNCPSSDLVLLSRRRFGSGTALWEAKWRRVGHVGRFGRPRPFRGCVLMRSGPRLDAQMLPQGQSGDAPSRPGAARNRPKASPGRPRDAARAPGTTPKTLASAVRVAKHNRKRPWIDFLTFSGDVRKLRSAFRIAPASVLSMSDVLRVERSWRRKTSK